MFTLERQNEIMEILKKNKFISINELAKRFYISTASIRRDLEKLEQQGLVKRTYGGVMLVEGVHAEIPLVVREAEQKNAKMKIAQRPHPLSETRIPFFRLLDDDAANLRFSRR